MYIIWHYLRMVSQMVVFRMERRRFILIFFRRVFFRWSGCLLWKSIIASDIYPVLLRMRIISRFHWMEHLYYRLFQMTSSPL